MYSAVKSSSSTGSKMVLYWGLVLSIFCIYNRIQLALTLNSVLDINGTFPYLVNKEPRDYMDFDNIYTPNETYRLKQTAQGRNYHMLKAFDFANYYQSDYWHYSSKEDLIQSAKPIANENLCAAHLNWLETKLNQSANLFKSGEQHINLMSYVDSFGRPEASTYYGHGYWLGSFYQCTKLSINVGIYESEECHSTNGINCSLPTNKTSPGASHTQEYLKANNNKQASGELKMRYCIGKGRDVDWPSIEEDNYVPTISYKIGLCIPETCETLSFQRHRAQLERLMRFNMPEYTKSRIYLNDIYCLPDSRSPIRSLPLSSRIFLGMCALWLAVLLAATSIYSCYKRHQRDLRNIITAEQVRRDLEFCTNPAHQQLVVDASPAQLNSCCCAVASPEQIYHFSSSEQKQLQQDAESVMMDSYETKESIEVTLEMNQQHQNQMLQQFVAPTTLFTNEKLTDGMLINGNKQSTKNQFINNETLNELLVMNGTTNKQSSIVNCFTSSANSNNLNDDQDSIGKKSQVSYANSSSTSSSSSPSTTGSSTFSSWLNLSESPTVIKLLQAVSIKENMREFTEPPLLLRTPDADRKLRINLNALDSIKCLCCVLVIFGHIVFIHMQHLSNIVHTIELSHELKPRFLIAFFNFVDTFFIISGMLTSYFIFKRFDKKTFSNPMIWLNTSLLRLLRLSPVYLLAFWFVKTMTVYIAEGPVWDYGTDKNSIKGLCINDQWWKSILYLGNWGTMQPLCILPAWSIIVDAQYSVILPPIIFLIFKHKRLGYLSLLLGIIVSTANMSFQLANQTAVKTSDMAKVRLHVYPLISRFAAEFYNTAWNRIGPVAIGVLGGHMLYNYDIGKIKRWPWFMRGASFKFILLLHLFIFILPAIGRFTDQPDTTTETDLTIFVLSNATIKPIWSLINTVFLLRLVTDLRTNSVLARLMSHNLWHCLGKLCFASYLIHYEVILVLLKSRQEGLVDPNWSNILREFSLAFLASTSISYIIYILYEAPVNKLITLTLIKPSIKRKKENYNNVDNIIT